MKKYKIEKHGRYFIDPEDITICPECGYELLNNHKNNYSESDWILFGILLKEHNYIKCSCPNCNCEFKYASKSRIKDVDFDIILDILPFVVIITGLVCVIIGFLTDWNDSIVLAIIGMCIIFFGCCWANDRFS